MIGGPSKYLQKERFWSKYESVVWMVGLITSYFVYLLINSYLQNAPLAATVLGLFMLVVYKLLNAKAWLLLNRAGRFKRGMDGERIVFDELRKLPDAYTVIQDVCIPGTRTNIDFVVLGPNGIWAIEVKSHDGTITYDGRDLVQNGKVLEKGFLWQANVERQALTELLQANVDRSLYAKGIIVFSNKYAKLKFGEVPIKETVVIGVSWLNRYILGRKSEIMLTNDRLQQSIAALNSVCSSEVDKESVK